MTVHQTAVEIEKNACNNRWLMVKFSLSELTPQEQDEALAMILDESKRITRVQYDAIQQIIDHGDLTTLVQP